VTMLQNAGKPHKRRVNGDSARGNIASQSCWCSSCILAYRTADLVSLWYEGVVV
jgi:hypothetical protein